MQARTIILSLSASLFAACNNAPQVKFAYVNIDEVVERADDGVRIRKQMEENRKALKAEIEEHQRQYEQKFEAYDKARIAQSLSAVQRTAMESELISSQKKLQTLLVQGDQELQINYLENLEAIQKEINAAVKEVAAEGQYNIVLNQGAFSYADDAFDITELVIAKMDAADDTETK